MNTVLNVAINTKRRWAVLGASVWSPPHLRKRRGGPAEKFSNLPGGFETDLERAIKAGDLAAGHWQRSRALCWTARVGFPQPAPKALSLTDLTEPVIDWPALAKGFGMPAWSVSTDDELAGTLGRALAEPGPALSEAVLA